MHLLALRIIPLNFRPEYTPIKHDEASPKDGNCEDPSTADFCRNGLCFSSVLYTLFQNGSHCSVPLFACKLDPVASFKGKYP